MRQKRVCLSADYGILPLLCLGIVCSAVVSAGGSTAVLSAAGVIAAGGVAAAFLTGVAAGIVSAAVAARVVIVIRIIAVRAAVVVGWLVVAVIRFFVIILAVIVRAGGVTPYIIFLARAYIAARVGSGIRSADDVQLGDRLLVGVEILVYQFQRLVVIRERRTNTAPRCPPCSSCRSRAV